MDSDISDFETTLKQQGYGAFVEQVTHAAENEGNVTLTLESFTGQPELLYTALRYASYHGITVLVLPTIEHRKL